MHKAEYYLTWSLPSIYEPKYWPKPLELVCRNKPWLTPLTTLPKPGKTWNWYTLLQESRHHVLQPWWGNRSEVYSLSFTLNIGPNLVWSVLYLPNAFHLKLCIPLWVWVFFVLQKLTVQEVSGEEPRHNSCKRSRGTDSTRAQRCTGLETSIGKGLYPFQFSQSCPSSLKGLILDMLQAWPTYCQGHQPPDSNKSNPLNVSLAFPRAVCCKSLLLVL